MVKSDTVVGVFFCFCFLAGAFSGAIMSEVACVCAGSVKSRLLGAPVSIDSRNFGRHGTDAALLTLTPFIISISISISRFMFCIYRKKIFHDIIQNHSHEYWFMGDYSITTTLAVTLLNRRGIIQRSLHAYMQVALS
jgi:hypothetical protein